MKKLKSFDKRIQERYEHKGRTYSIINLTVPALELKDTPAGDDYSELMNEAYYPNIYELADMTDSFIIIIARYPNIEDAKKEIIRRGKKV